MFHGLQDIQGYVEWHLNVVISSMLITRGVSPIDLLGISVVTMGITWLNKGSATDTLYNVAALMVARSFSINVMQYITSIGGMNDITVILGIVIISTAIIHVFSAF